MAHDATDVDDTFERILKALDYKVTYLHATWQVYVQLFSAKADLELLSETGGFAMGVVQRELIDSVLLGIARLTDPPSTGKFQNLSLRRLADRCLHEAKGNASSRQTLRDDLLVHLNVISLRAENIIRHRMKRIAHTDLSMLRPEEHPPGIPRNEIEEALGLIRDYMNRINLHEGEGETQYDKVLFSPDGGSLLFYLRFGRQLAELHDRFTEGKLTESQLADRVRNLYSPMHPSTEIG